MSSSFSKLKIFNLLFLILSFQGICQTTITFDDLINSEGLSTSYTREGFIFSINATNGRVIQAKTTLGYEGSTTLYDNNPEIGGITQWSIKKEDGGVFNFISIFLQDAGLGGSSSGTIQGYLDNAPVGSSLAIVFDSSTSGLKDFSFNPDFENIDEIRINATDINFYLDHFSFTVPGAPVATAPSAPTVNEDESNVALVDNIHIADEDGNDQTVTFTITGGTLSLGASGITFGDPGNGSSSFTASGTLAAINAALDAATFTPSPNLYGSNVATISLVSNNGIGDSNVASVTFDIEGVNDDPTFVGLPASITVNEDEERAFLSNALSDGTFADIDAGSNEVSLMLQVDMGVIALSAPGGISVGLSGNGTKNVIITGTVADIESYISINTNVSYVPAANETSIATMTLSANDNGNTGFGGGTEVGLGSFQINITAVNDAPRVILPGTISVAEDVSTALMGISFSDVDTESGSVTVDMSVAVGSLFATSGGGVTISGSGSSSITFDGTIADINAFIADSKLTYQNASGNTADQTLAVSISDNGNTGSGGSLMDSSTTVLTIAQPAVVTSVSVPANRTYTIGENLVFSVIFDEDMDVDTSGGTPRLSLTIGASTRYASYISGSGTSSLVYRYIIESGDHDVDGIALGALEANGGRIQNNNVDADLILQNVGSTSGVLVDAVAPSGYSIVIDQAEINGSNQTAISFTFAGAELGANYDYTFSSSAGGTIVSGSGTVVTATEQISGIDLSGLNDGTITLTVSLEDSFGNTGAPVTDTSIKKINEAPIGVDDEFSIGVSTVLTGNVLTNDSDPNGDALTASLVSAPANGTIVLNADGSFTYTPNTNYVGSDSLMYQVCDNGTPSLCDTTTMLRFNVIDTAIPTGYSVSWDDHLINAAEASATSFTVADAEIGATLNYTLFSSGDGNTQTISGTDVILSTTANYTVDTSNLQDGILTIEIYLTSKYGTPGIVSSDNSALLDKTAPSGYAVSIDQDPIDGSNQSAVSFTFSGAELGASYNYSFTGETADSSITGTGTVTAAHQQVSGIDLSTLADGTITLSTSLEDPAGNTGVSVTDTSLKETNNAPTASDVTVTGALSVGEQLSGDYTFSDPDGDIDSGSTFLWHRSDDESGVGKTEISGAVSNQYTLQSADRGKYISFTVTPNDGIIGGSSVESALVGPVKVDQHINFPSIPDKTYGDLSFTLGEAQSDQSLLVTYTAADPSVVLISGNQATILKAGTTTITATQAGDGQTSSAVAVTQTLTVRKATLLVSPVDASKVYGETDPELTFQATGFVNGEDMTIITGTLSRESGENAGNYPITLGTLKAGTNYDLDLEAADFEIVKATQEIVWNQDLSFGCGNESEVVLTASSNSGLPVTYNVLDTSIAEVLGAVLTHKQSGTTTIIASQPGNENYLAAVSIEKTVRISQKGLIRQHWDDVLVFDNSSGGFISYQWYKDGAPISGATGQYYSESEVLSGSYYVEATTESGQVITSCTLELSNEGVAKKVSVVPNPVWASSDFTLKNNYEQDVLNGASISVIDLTGRVVQTVPATGIETRLTAPTQTGIYIVLLRLSDGSRRTVNLLVK